MGQEEAPGDPEWSRRWARAIGQNIARLRRLRELSAQQLSDKCTELGYPLPRSTIANIESGRKRDLPVQELVVLSAALQVPLARLILPVEGAETVELLPGVQFAPGDALSLITGENHGGEYSGPLAWLREHRSWLDYYKRLLIQDPNNDRGLMSAVMGLIDARDVLRRLDVALPEVPEDILLAEAEFDRTDVRMSLPPEPLGGSGRPRRGDAP